jgi:hypothetical protein
MNAMKYSSKVIDFGNIGNAETGFLTVAQIEKNVSFPIKRVYWTYLTPENIVRGHHAHRELKQIIFALAGKIELEIENPYREKQIFTLSNPRFGLFIPEMNWRTIRFDAGAILLSLASLPYDENEYIRDYKDFVKLCNTLAPQALPN